MSSVWTHQTSHGVWLIGNVDEKYVLLFNGEWLAEGESVDDLLSKIARGNTLEPSIGIKPKEILPLDISKWHVGQS